MHLSKLILGTDVAGKIRNWIIRDSLSKKNRSLWVIIAIATLAIPSFTSAQASSSIENLPVGASNDEIGVDSGPNQECVGPKSIVGTSDGKLALLDVINQKIALLSSSKVSDIPLPKDVSEPQDLLAVSAGFVVAGGSGDVAIVSSKGAELSHVKVPHNPEKGAIRIVPLNGKELALEELDGKILRIPFNVDTYGGISDPGIVNASGYVGKSIDETKYSLTNSSITGPLAHLTVDSSIRIVGARVIWQNKEGALVAVQQTQRLPVDSSFVRIVKFDDQGSTRSEAYVPANAYACGTDRPFVRTSDGSVLSLAFRGDGGMSLQRLAFAKISANPPPDALQAETNATLIAEDETALTALERLNGTSDAAAIALSTTTTDEIMKRARAALDLRWTLAAVNFSHADVENACVPPGKIWRRPQRLDNQANAIIKAVPYRWGGYLSNLDKFKTSLSNGLLAGNVCTCRNADCVNPKTTGFDCSGFVSYTWNTGNYFTTASLPNRNVSSSVAWSSLRQGDIVNKARNHVRLVESIAQSSNGPLVTVIESTTLARCGGVCRSTYTAEQLKREGYKPYRRVGLTDIAGQPGE